MEESRLVMLTCAKGAMKAANIMPREARARPHPCTACPARAGRRARLCAHCGAAACAGTAPRRPAAPRRCSACVARACERARRAAGGHPDHGEHICAGAVAERDGGQLLWHALGRAALQPGRPGLHVGHHRGGARAAPAQGAPPRTAARPRARAHARPLPAKVAPGRPLLGGRGVPRRPPASPQVGRARVLAGALRCQCQEPAQSPAPRGHVSTRRTSPQTISRFALAREGDCTACSLSRALRRLGLGGRRELIARRRRARARWRCCWRTRTSPTACTPATTRRCSSPTCCSSSAAARPCCPHGARAHPPCGAAAQRRAMRMSF